LTGLTLVKAGNSFDFGVALPAWYFRGVIPGSYFFIGKKLRILLIPPKQAQSPNTIRILQFALRSLATSSS